MSFWGKSFTFNGVPCEDFGLMLYDIGEHRNSAGSFASTSTIIEDKTAKRWKPIFYGVKHDNKLEFSLVFGVNPDRIESHHHLDRGELDAIASWLTGHNEYHWLEFDQDDMMGIRYRAMITSLKVVEYGRLPWAFEATVVCDSPYAYQYPRVFEYDVGPGDTITFYNESCHNGYFYPKIELTINEQVVDSKPVAVRSTKTYLLYCSGQETSCQNADGETVDVHGGHYIDQGLIDRTNNQIDLYKNKYHSIDDVVVDNTAYTGVPGGLCYSIASTDLVKKEFSVGVQCETTYRTEIVNGKDYYYVVGHAPALSGAENEMETCRKMYNAKISSVAQHINFTGSYGRVDISYDDDGGEVINIDSGRECENSYTDSQQKDYPHFLKYELEYTRCTIDGDEFENTPLDGSGICYFHTELGSDVVGTIMARGKEYIICDRNGNTPSDEDRALLFNAGQSVCVQLDEQAGKASVLGAVDDLAVGEVYYGSTCPAYPIRIDDRYNVVAETPHHIEHTATYTFISLSDSVYPDSTVKIIAPCNNCAGVWASFTSNGIDYPEHIKFWWDDEYEFNAGDTLYVKLDRATETASIVSGEDASLESGTFSIVNETDNNRKFEFNTTELFGKTVVVDNDLGIISADGVINPYQYFNFNFLRLVKGYNTLKFDGYAKLKIICEFPINVGG